MASLLSPRRIALWGWLCLVAGCAEQVASEPAASTTSAMKPTPAVVTTPVAASPAISPPAAEAPSPPPTVAAAPVEGPALAPATGPVPAPAGVQGVSQASLASSTPTKPYVRLTTRSKGTLIVAADFQGVKDQLDTLDADARRTFILKACVDLALENKLDQEEGITQLKIYALLIEGKTYQVGSFKGVTQLAIVEADAKQIADTAQDVAARVANVKWIDKGLQR